MNHIEKLSLLAFIMALSLGPYEGIEGKMAGLGFLVAMILFVYGDKFDAR